MQRVKRLCTQVLLALALTLALPSTGKVTAKAADVIKSEIKLYTTGPVWGEKIYRVESRLNPGYSYYGSWTVTMPKGFYAAEIGTHYNEHGYRKGIKWTKEVFNDRKHRWEEETMDDDDIFDPKNPTFYHMYVLLNSKNGFWLSNLPEKYSLWAADVPDYCYSEAEIEEYGGTYIELKFTFASDDPARKLSNVEFVLDEPQIGQKVSDAKFKLKDGDELIASRLADAGYSDSWYRFPGTGSEEDRKNLGKWTKVKPGDTFEKDYYYKNTGVKDLADTYLEKYQEYKNHYHKHGDSPAVFADGKSFTWSITSKSGYDDQKNIRGLNNSGEWTTPVLGNKIDLVRIKKTGRDSMIPDPGETFSAENWKFELDGNPRYELDTSFGTKGIEWLRETNHDVEVGETISAGKKYYLCVMVKPKSGYEFAEHVDMEIDPNESDCEPFVLTDCGTDAGSNKMLLAFRFTAPSVNRFDIGIPGLCAGDKISYDITFPSVNPKYTLCTSKDNATRQNGVEWRTAYWPENALDKDADVELIGGSDYWIDIILQAGSSAYLPSDPYSLSRVVVDVDLFDREIRIDGNNIEITGRWSCPKAVRQLEFTVGTTLRAGEVPSDICTVKSDVFYPNPFTESELFRNAWNGESYVLTGMKDQWCVSADGEEYTKMSSDTFVAGKYYGTKAIGYFANLVYSSEAIESGSLGIKPDAKVIVNGEDTGLTWGQIVKMGDNYIYEFGQLDQNAKIDISLADVSGIVNKIYTGSAIELDVQVKMDELMLREGTDYEVIYQDNVKPSTDEKPAKVTIKGIGNYTGTIEETFYILEPWGELVGILDITKAVVTGITDKAYTGSPVKQDIVVTFDEKKLTEGTDYTVAYEKNTEVGEATVIITGAGLYKGTIRKTFKITEGGSKIDGVGTISVDGKILTDPDGVTYAISAKLTEADLKKGQSVADQPTGGKYRITKLVFKKGKLKSGTVAYLGPWNRNTELISIPGKIKLAGVPFTVETISANCGKGVTKVKKVVIGANVKTIGKNAFKGCATLKMIQIKSAKLKKVGKGALKGINKKAVIKVPKNKKGAYKRLLKNKGQAKSVKIK